MDITVEVVPALYAVRLTAANYTGTVHWYEDEGATNRHIGDGAVLMDRRGRLNQELTYFAVDDVETKSATATIPADLPVLSSTATSVAWEVEVIRWRPLRGYGLSTAHFVLGRSDPFVTIHPAAFPEGQLQLLARTPTQRERIVDLIRPGDPLHIRTTCPERLATFEFIVRSWADPFLSDEARDGYATVDIDYQAVQEVLATQPAPDRTYGDVAADHTTYQEVADLYASYQGLLDGVQA